MSNQIFFFFLQTANEFVQFVFPADCKLDYKLDLFVDSKSKHKKCHDQWFAPRFRCYWSFDSCLIGILFSLCILLSVFLDYCLRPGFSLYSSFLWHLCSSYSLVLVKFVFVFNFLIVISVFLWSFCDHFCSSKTVFVLNTTKFLFCIQKLDYYLICSLLYYDLLSLSSPWFLFYLWIFREQFSFLFHIVQYLQIVVLCLCLSSSACPCPVVVVKCLFFDLG